MLNNNGYWYIFSLPISTGRGERPITYLLDPLLLFHSENQHGMLNMTLAYECTPKSAHWLTPLNDIAWFLIPGTRVGLLCRVALISPSSVSPTMSSKGKYRSGAKADTVFILYILNCLSYFVVLLSIISY